MTTVTRALGFHGDPTLRQCLSQKPYCNTVPLLPNDEYIIIGVLSRENLIFRLGVSLYVYINPRSRVVFCHFLYQP